MSLLDLIPFRYSLPPVPFCRSHVFLSLSCRETSPVLPTHDREDPLANVNARITVFIALVLSLSPPPLSPPSVSLSIASSPPINTYAQCVVRR